MTDRVSANSEERSTSSVLMALIQNMRPKQWAKNGFVFAAILFDKKLFDGDSIAKVMITFALMCLTASAIYIVNDIVDVEKDRQHPKKKNRPIASGQLPIPFAASVAAVYFLIAVIGAIALDFELAGVVIAYIALHVGYSFIFKNIVIIDVFSIATGFILRILAGVVVIDVVQFSPWLYVCAGLLSLFLAIGKRRQELIYMGENAANTRSILAEYNLALVSDMLRLTITSTAIAYTLYTTEAETILVSANYMLLTVPIVYYALFRYMYVIYVKDHGGDPTEILFEDRPLQLSIAFWVILIVVLFYVV